MKGLGFRVVKTWGLGCRAYGTSKVAGLLLDVVVVLLKLYSGR